VKQNKKDIFPLYRHEFSNFFIMSYRLTTPLKAEVLVVEDKEKVNDFFLGMGLKTIKSFEGETWRKAYNQAKKWAIQNIKLEA